MRPFKLARQSQVIKSYKVFSVLEQHVCHMLLFVTQCVDDACQNLALNRPFKWQFCSVMPFCMPWSCSKLVSIRAFLSTHRKSLFSLPCVSSETHNLQRVFRPRGVVPYIGYIGRNCTVCKWVLWCACDLFSAMFEMTCHVNHLFDIWKWCNFSVIEALEFSCIYTRV